MSCPVSPERLGAYWDDELDAGDAKRIREHLDHCGECERRLAELAQLGAALKATMVRHRAPDVVRARIRNALAAEVATARMPPRVRPRWAQLAAAVVVTALVSGSGGYLVARRQAATQSTTEAVVTAHVRSLMPGHLTDVASDEHHSVKPWFNGRVDLSPNVPNLDSLGFPLVGGRLDVIDGRAVAAVVYARRQHMINVFSWPTSGSERAPTVTRGERGYHIMRWSRAGLETWVVSDLNAAELQQFTAVFTAAR